jgi:hypothetical protein
MNEEPLGWINDSTSDENLNWREFNKAMEPLFEAQEKARRVHHEVRDGLHYFIDENGNIQAIMGNTMYLKVMSWANKEAKATPA